MRVLLRFSDAELREAVVLDDLAERLVDVLRRKSDRCIHAVLVLGERSERDLEILIALEAVERLVDERMRELASTIRAEVEEDGAVAILHALIALDDERHDELVVDAVLVACLEAGYRVVCYDALCMSDGLIGLLLAVPAMVAVHCVVAAGDRRDLADADLLALCLELLDVRLCALRRHIAAVEEGVDVDVLDALLLCHLEQCVEVALVAVYAARGNEAEQMDSAAIGLGILHDLDEDFVLEEVAVLNITRDARELLVDEAAGTDVRVTDFRVAHLAVRQADEFAGSLQVARVVVCHEAVEDRSLRSFYGIALVELTTETAAIHDDECDRCVFDLCHCGLLLLLKGTESVVDDLAEVLSLERCTADEGAIDVRLLHEILDRSRLDAAAVLDADAVSCFLAEFCCNRLADVCADFLSLLERSRLARADCPDWLISDDKLSDFFRLEASESSLDLACDEVEVDTGFALLEGLTAADDRRDASSESSMSALVDALIRLAEVTAALAVTEDAVVYADLVEHARGDLAREGTVAFPMDVLCTDVDVRAECCVSDSCESRSRRADDNRDLGVLDERSQTADEVLALDDRVVHLPVACNDRSSCHF